MDNKIAVSVPHQLVVMFHISLEENDRQPIYPALVMYTECCEVDKGPGTESFLKIMVVQNTP